jgi:signal transduction histidine kinase/HAMP domain-containing protein
MKLSIRSKLIFYTFCIAFFVGGGISVYSMHIGRERLMLNFEHNSRDITSLLAETIFDDLYFSNLQSLRLRLKSARINPAVNYTIVSDPDGTILADGTDKNLRQDEKITDDFSRRGLDANGWISEIQQKILRVGGPILAPDGERRGYLEVGFGLQATEQIFKDEIRSGLEVTAVGLLAGALLAVLLASNFTRPIDSIVSASREIGQGKLQTRLSIKRRDEFGALSNSINEMAQSLQQRHAEIQTLREIDRAVTSTLNLTSVLHVLLERITLLVPDSAATIWLINPGTRMAERIACWNLDENEWKARLMSGIPAPIQRIVNSKTPLCVENVQVPGQGFDLQFLRKVGLNSYLGMPLVAKGEMLGVLSIFTKFKQSFADEEIQFFAALSSQAAMAIYNSELYEQTKKQAAELEQTNKQQADFTAMIAHDLRSPLQTTIGVVAMMEDSLFGPVNEEQKKWLHKIDDTSRKLIDLVSDFLDISKIEAGEITLDKEEVSPKNIIREILESYQPRGRAKGLVLSDSVDAGLPNIDADPRRIEQVLSNLLSNAIKFTQEDGTIEVAAYQEGRSIRIDVKDSGVGIPADEIDRLFAKYQQTTSGKTSRQKGTGLGLVICKMIVEAHGGKIWAASEPGAGSTFSFCLPLKDRCIPLPVQTVTGDTRGSSCAV